MREPLPFTEVHEYSTTSCGLDNVITWFIANYVAWEPELYFGFVTRESSNGECCRLPIFITWCHTISQCQNSILSLRSTSCGKYRSCYLQPCVVLKSIQFDKIFVFKVKAHFQLVSTILCSKPVWDSTSQWVLMNALNVIFNMHA